MNSFSLPLNFGERFEDRSLLVAAAAEGVARDAVYRAMVRVWQDFATDRSTARMIPADEERRATSPTVGIIEEFAGWGGGPGRFVALALGCGFMQAAPAGEGMLRLSLAGFQEINRKAPNTQTLGRLGGIGRARNFAAKAAKGDADDVLELFRRHENAILTEIGPEKIHRALVFIYQVARLLRWSAPADQEFLTALVPKALETLRVLGVEKDAFLAWLVAHREEESLPRRLDLLFDATESLLSQAREWGG